ncbi:MAG: methyltransferase domain-containing protein [Lachnospiraceae bacterium]|nr:methyltransferase domain-containing protein [Lachnospiraceae bacterium]
MNNIEEYYNKFNEEKRLNSRHGQIEFRITMKYIHEIINKVMEQNNMQSESELKLLDIGAGTGRYSVPLCEEGYDVTAVELVKYNLGILKKKQSNVKAYQGNALKLKRFSDASFDVTLLFGPMYHLINDSDKIQALREAKRVTKPGGYILVAYVMNEYAVIVHGIQEGTIKESIEEGLLSDKFRVTPKEDDLYDYVRIEDIDRYNKEAGLTREKILSPDGAANYIRPFLNRLDEESFEYFIRYQEAVCERADLIGAGAHTVDILVNRA